MSNALRLRLAMLSEVLVDTSVTRVVADGTNGSFCLLPRHQDWVAPLTVGVLVWTLEGGQEQYAAHNSGLLVKVGPEVLVTVRAAVLGDSLSSLARTFQAHEQAVDRRQAEARESLARLESSLVRRFVDFQEGRRV